MQEAQNSTAHCWILCKEGGVRTKNERVRRVRGPKTPKRLDLNQFTGHQQRFSVLVRIGCCETADWLCTPVHELVTGTISWHVYMNMCHGYI